MYEKYENIVNSLRYCAGNDCSPKCPRAGIGKGCITGLKQAAADAIEELTGFVQEAERDRDEYRERLDKANDAIEELQGRAKVLEKVADKWYEAAPKWIPVTERLPEADEEVFIYLWDNPRAYIAWVGQEGQWETNDFYVDKDYLPKAWMPLPKPYEPPKEK